MFAQVSLEQFPWLGSPFYLPCFFTLPGDGGIDETAGRAITADETYSFYAANVITGALEATRYLLMAAITAIPGHLRLAADAAKVSVLI
jgi:hypothetical protein